MSSAAKLKDCASGHAPLQFTQFIFSSAEICVICGRMYRRCGFRYEKKLRANGVVRVAGIDEAGRGALAGPVVAAAVVLPEKFRHRRLNDSKQLAPELREEIYVDLTSNSQITWAVGVVDSIEIDRINILRASHRAMRFAVGALIEQPHHVLID